MRKPRNYDAELKALENKAKDLKARKVQQLGELVIATGADALTAEELAGALVVLAETTDAGRRESWAKRGAAFFQGRSRLSTLASERDAGGVATQPGGTQPTSGSAGAAYRPSIPSPTTFPWTWSSRIDRQDAGKTWFPYCDDEPVTSSCSETAEPAMR